MKLYNLYESVILEEINSKRLLLEGVSDAAIDDVLRNKRYVNIKYKKDKEEQPTDRYVQVYNRGETKAGNPAIRVYQAGGESETGVGEWKIFLIDRIVSFEPTNMKWHNPISDYSTDIPSYNQTGDESMRVVHKSVDFDEFTRQRSDISQGPNYKKPIKPIKQKPRPKLDVTNQQEPNQQEPINQEPIKKIPRVQKQKPRPRLDITNNDNENDNEI